LREKKEQQKVGCIPCVNVRYSEKIFKKKIVDQRIERILKLIFILKNDMDIRY
jgi:hypothetical protein